MNDVTMASLDWSDDDAGGGHALGSTLLAGLLPRSPEGGLRGASEPGTTVESSLDRHPVETNTTEAGVVHSTGTTRFGVTWFRSGSDFGSRLVPNADGIFAIGMWIECRIHLTMQGPTGFYGPLVGPLPTPSQRRDPTADAPVRRHLSAFPRA